MESPSSPCPVAGNSPVICENALPASYARSTIPLGFFSIWFGLSSHLPHPIHRSRRRVTLATMRFRDGLVTPICIYYIPLRCQKKKNDLVTCSNKSLHVHVANNACVYAAHLGQESKHLPTMVRQRQGVRLNRDFFFIFTTSTCIVFELIWSFCEP